MALNIQDIKTSLNSFFQQIIKNIISLGDDSTLESDLKPIKVGGKVSPVEISETELKIRGTINAEAINVNGSAVQTGTDGLNDLSDVTYSGGDLTIDSIDTIVASSDLTLDVGGDIELNADGGQVSIKDDSASHFLFNCDHTFLRIYDDTNANDFFDITVAAEGATKIATTDADTTAGHLSLAPDGDLILNPKEGKYIAQKDGTEFSAADSAYAGMILGYTDIGLDEAAVAYSLTTSYAVPTSEFKVVFVAPPSGNVEIFIQIQFDCGGNGVGDLYAGLSDNATYNTIEDINEELLIDQSGRFGLDTVHHRWTKTGLTAGTSYTYYAGFKSSSATGTPHLQWGGDAADRSPDFIMKATALPATILT